MERWPNFFIVGTSKAGTTSLYEYLKNIPGIFMSPNKEPNFFSKKTLKETFPFDKPIRIKEDYLKLFENAKNEKILGESSTLYLPDPDVPHLIYEVCPNARILISLRDPVEREFSMYLMERAKGHIDTTFHDQIKWEFQHRNDYFIPGLRVEVGLYSKAVKRYLDTFSHKQVKIIIFEEFIGNEKEALEEILKFLGIDYDTENFRPEVHNPYSVLRGPLAEFLFYNKSVINLTKKILSKSSRKFLKKKILFKTQSKPQMDQKDREALVEFYRDDVQKLQLILGRKLPWKNFDYKK